MGGRGRNNRTQRKHFKDNRENVWKRSRLDSEPGSNDGTTPNNGREDRRDADWQPFATQNPAFEEYYKRQGMVTDEEWDTFIDCLRKPLPAAFRINSSGQFCPDILLQLENDFVKTLQEEFTGEDEADALRPLPWYPSNLAWHSNFSRNQIRRNQTLARFHEFLKLANEIGNITRQEAVSMVPPLFLDVHPEHFVLDMCAAPGSKTFQLLEIIHKSSEPGGLPSGIVVANDVDIQRSNLLIHQTKRMCTSNLIVANHEAQNFPGCSLKKYQYNGSDAKTHEPPILDQLLFDRVLCDVPCSGDGTLRKAPDMWKKWSVGMGNGVHSLQIQIAMRGLALLRVGGRMVYSTCSMNPVENEAVVAEILRRCKDSVELVDVSTELPQLVRRPGLKTWKVRDKGCWISSYKEVKMYRRAGIVPTMFPGGRTDVEMSDNDQSKSPGSEEMEETADSDVEEICSLPLERCMRLVPHDQNTGAFFIAVFQKHAPLPPAAVQKKTAGLNGKREKVSSEVSTDGGKEESETAVCAEGRSEIVVSEVSTDGGKEESETAVCAEGRSEIVVSEVSTDGSKEESETAVCAEGRSEIVVFEEPETSNIDGSKDQQKVETEGTGSEKGDNKRKLQMQGRIWIGVDPVLFFKDEKIIDQIKNFYGIADYFPLYGHLVCRNSDTSHVKRIYYISKSVKDVLELNFSVGHQLKIASVGLKMFERQTSREGTNTPCSFRISSEGLPVVLPHITKQILHASAIDFRHLLKYKYVKFGDFVDPEFDKAAAELSMGYCVIVLREAGRSFLEPIEVTPLTLAIGCWKGKSNISVMVTALDCQDLLERVEKRFEADGIIYEKKAALPEASPEIIDVDPEIVPDVDPKIIPDVDPEVIPDVDPKIIPDVDPEVIPDVDPEVIPDVDPEVIPDVDPEIIQVSSEIIPDVGPEIIQVSSDGDESKEAPEAIPDEICTSH